MSIQLDDAPAQTSTLHAYYGVYEKNTQDYSAISPTVYVEGTVA